jgi:hypothetical protein
MVRSDRPNNAPTLCRAYNEPSPLERAETENGDGRGVMVRIGRRARAAICDGRGVMVRIGRRARKVTCDARGVMERSDRPNHAPTLCRGFNEPSPLERAETADGDGRGVMVRIGRRARKVTCDGRGVMERIGTPNHAPNLCKRVNEPSPGREPHPRLS